VLLSASLALPVAQAHEVVTAPSAPAANARGSPAAVGGLAPSTERDDAVEPTAPEIGEDADRRAAAFMIGTVFALAFATAVGPRALASRARAGTVAPTPHGRDS
jgi:hypothetical protein